MASSQDAKRSAAQIVFDIPELKEMILLQQDPKDLLDHLHHDASLITTVRSSRALQRKLYVQQKPESKVKLPSWVSEQWMAVANVNKILLPNEDSEFAFRLSDDGPEYLLRIRSKHRHLIVPNGEPNMIFWEEYRLDIIDEHAKTAPILPPAYFSMHLFDHEMPTLIGVHHFGRRTGRNRMRDCAKPSSGHFGHYGGLWIPSGRTFGDVIRVVDFLENNRIKESDLVNDIWHGHLGDVQFDSRKPKCQQEDWNLRKGGAWVAPWEPSN